MRKLNILIVDAGGRGSAIGRSIAASPRAGAVFYTPGNAGADPAFRGSVKMTDIEGIVSFAEKKRIDLVIPGSETSLALGLVDALKEKGIRAFGPDRFCARLEASKSYALMLANELNIPTGGWTTATRLDDAERKILKFREPPVIKADGLAAGKGVVVPKKYEEATQAARGMLVNHAHGQAGDLIVIQKRLYGKEFSVIGICNGVDVLLLPLAQDHKRAGDGDTGPNTGGMGAYSPLSWVSPELLDDIKRRFFLPLLRAMAERGHPYHGFLYAGLMLTDDGPKLIEWNVRLGDPEAQVLLPRLKSDLLALILHALKPGGSSRIKTLDVSDQAAVCIALTAADYPGMPKTGGVITGIEKAARRQDVLVFHGGTESGPDGTILTAGGRVLYVVGLGATIAEARAKAYAAAADISFPHLRFRYDIAAAA